MCRVMGLRVSTGLGTSGVCVRHPGWVVKGCGGGRTLSPGWRFLEPSLAPRRARDA